MPADGATAAFSPPGDIGNPGSGSDGTIHRLCFTPEVKRCRFYQLTKIIADHVGLRDRHFSNLIIRSKESRKFGYFCDACNRNTTSAIRRAEDYS
jgi:hypothetical protein